MSGDVQPRKRKDKRRKRDDRKSEGEVSFSRQQSFQDDDESSHGVHITKMGNDDVHLHVHHEHGTGGHWCAKIIFFSLMAVLLGLVGLIIMENRGLADLDTPLSESRFSNYFDGWVDEHREEHDEHDKHGAAAISGEDHDDHDDHDDDDDHDEHDDHDDDEDAEEEAEENDDDDEATAEKEADEEQEYDQDEDEDTAAEDDGIEESIELSKIQKRAESAPNKISDNLDEDDEEDDEDNEETTEQPQSQLSTENEADNDDEEDDAENDVDDEDDNEEVEESLEPPQSNTPEDDADEDDDEADDDADDDDADEEDIEESVEPPKSQSKPESTPNANDEDFDDDDFESLDQTVDNEAEELLLRQEKAREAAAAASTADITNQDTSNDNDNDAEATESSWFSSLLVKFGVGVALALVSRLVLIRKNPNTTEEMNQEACMRRRLTIASAEDHIPDDDEELPPLDDEYSEEEIEIEEEIEVEISDIEEAADGVEGGSDDNVAASHSYVPETFEQLSAQYKSKQEAQQEPKEITAVSTAAPTKTREQISTPKTSASDPEPTVSTDIYVEYEDGAAEDYAQDENDEITDEEDEIDDDYGYELEEGDISDVDDTELMNRLEAKYGRLPAKEYESDADSDDPTWTQIKPKEAAPGAGPKAKLNTDDDDDLFEAELRKANAEMIRENPNPANALRAFNNLIIKYTHKSSAHLARARALEQLAEIRQSNEILEQAIDSYKRYLAFAELISDDGEFRAAGERCIEHLRFMGYQQQAVAIHELLIDRFWEEPQQRNQLTLTYLMINNLELVRRTAGNTLKIWPQDALAQLYYGLAVKQLDRDYARALPYLKYGIESGLRGTQEGFFYLALGETLQRLGKQSEALAVYERGVEKQFFPSVYQRALYNEPHLRAQPFWDVAETGYAESFEKLQRNWSAIRDEALALLNHHGNFQEETEQLRDTGDWTQFELYAQGQRVGRNCQRAPITCALLADFFPAATSCRRGQVKFSAMRAQTHVWPHCGPTNCRLRAHLGLVTPEPQLTSLRVAEQLRTWQAGELFIFDDSFEHEVWHNGTELRLVLIVDVWHPDLTADQRLSMSEI